MCPSASGANCELTAWDNGWIVRSVIRHVDLEGHKPFKDWDRYPITMVFSYNFV